MNKQLTFISACLFSLSTLGHASVLEFKAGAGSWSADLEGTIQDKDFFGGDGTEIDFEDTLGFDKTSQTALYVHFEHPVPILPNVRLAYTELKFDETTLLSQTLEIDGLTFNINEQVSSTFDFTHTDATLYYEVLDSLGGIVDLDLGLTGRIFSDGEIRIASATTGEAQEDISGVLPMLYTDAVVHIPTTGLYAGIQANLLGVGGDGVYDIALKAGWQTPWFVGLEVVHRTITLDFEDDDDVEVDLDMSGTYASLFLTF